MYDAIIMVDVPEIDKTYAVRVTRAEDHMHARLAAYHHIYGLLNLPETPSRERLLALTHYKLIYGIVDAPTYKNPYKKGPHCDHDRAQAAVEYYANLGCEWCKQLLKERESQ